jgi:SNF2 family DNA or RNA helicase|tara:strand:- start:470 stop:1903 length:1434 start_codon:yes stop_codon:yes gene_type:complete
MDYKFKTEPYEHQLQALGASHNKENFALFMEMGTGKSKVLIDNIAMLHDKGKINAALIVAPKGVYRNWEKQEIPTHMPEHVPYSILVWNSSSTKFLKDYAKFIKDQDRLKIFLINIDAFSTSRGTEICKRFLTVTQCLMAIDESTTIKTPTAKRTKTVCKMRTLAKYRRILTGSPVTKSPLDLYTQCYFLDPELLGFASFYSFKNRYAIMISRSVATHSFKQIVDYQRLDELEHKLNQFSYRVLKSECLDLPEKIYTKRYVEMTSEQKKAYVEMKNFAISVLEKETVTAAGILTQMIKLHQITCGHLITDEGKTIELKNNRIDELLNLLEETDGKVIIWAIYRHDIKKIEEILAKKYGKDSVETYYGDTKDSERQPIVDRFMDSNDNLRFFVGNPKTGGYGLTLTSSHTVVYFSNSYDLETRLQSEDRAHRISQNKKVTYVDLIAEKTVDEKIIKSLRNKINIATKVLGEDFKEWLI